jgi:hypothetical protein
MHKRCSKSINAMAKAKRMSDVFASSAEKNSTATTTAATPYSSEGPTLPIIGEDYEHNAISKKRKAQAQDVEKLSTQRTQPIATFHPALFTPWTLLPAELCKSLVSQARLRGAENVVPVVFTKNQNVRAGINRLKTYLGAYKDQSQSLDTPEALKENDVILAYSAQGEGTAKLVSILDVARRAVAPGDKGKEEDEQTVEWWVYTSLASVEVEKKAKITSEAIEDVKLGQDRQVILEEDEEEDAFEPMEVDTPHQEEEQQRKQMIKAPVLTVWMTKKNIPALKEAFGEQVWEVLISPQDD